MRHLSIVALAALLLTVAVTPAAAKKSQAPLRFGGINELGGTPLLGSAPGGGDLLRFLPHAHFGMGGILHNRSGMPLVITGARVLTPPRSLMHQIGTRFHRWTAWRCPPNVASCPLHGFPIDSHPYRLHPRPITVRPGKGVAVELNFVLGNCAQIRNANNAPLTRLRVTFRRPDGTVGHRTLSFGRASTIYLRTPKAGDCSNPRSSLSVNGPQQYASSQLWTIPGSTGDVCTIRNGALNFLSRKYQTHTSRAYNPNHYERITLHMDRFKGPGTYHRGTVKLVLAAKKVVFRSHHPNLEVTKVNAREVIATLQTGRRPSVAIRGTIRCRVTR